MTSPFPPLSHQNHNLLVNTIKALAMDAVQKANSGHPGMPMGTAAVASVLWTQFLSHDPQNPQWLNRDRFVLSAGHGSLLLYALLHLSGYDLPIEELKNFRQWQSKTPGHPEFGHTHGVEVTTGPLGTGFAAGVGLALAERILAARFNQPTFPIIDHFTYGIVSDGDLMEGVASEAASLAGHLELGKLIYLYDDNNITIDGATNLSFSENVGERFLAYGWQVLRVDGYDALAVANALAQARVELTRPSLIMCKTTIGHGSPNKAGQSSTHGAPLGKAEIIATKQAMNWPVEPDFYIPPEIHEWQKQHVLERAQRRHAWDELWNEYRREFPTLAQELKAALADELPQALQNKLPQFTPGTAIATRKASQQILQVLMEHHPTLVGGSADLAGSNGVPVIESLRQSSTNPGGRSVHFGVREHGMAGICNGLALHGGLRSFSATFLVFSDFMRGALRLSALMQLPVIHIFSHDSFWLGEDGPTHQPIEHVMSLRMIPNLYVVRPADAKETLGAWQLALERKVGQGPTAILLTRQDLPVLHETQTSIQQGAYVLWQPEAISTEQLDGILLATGSEVALALAAAKQLHSEGRAVRVVSMPCWKAFEAQPLSYQHEVLPPSLVRRLSVEAGTTLGWARFAAHQHGIDHFGASAPAEILAEKFAFTVERVIERYLAIKTP